MDNALNLFLLCLAESFFLVSALSIDAFTAGLSYGASGIKIPAVSALILALVSALMLSASLILGKALMPFMPIMLTKALSFLMLFLLGAIKLWQSLKGRFRHLAITKREGLRRDKCDKKSGFSAVFDDYKNADADCSRRLSPSEAVLLSVALSLDGLCAGFSVGLNAAPMLQTLATAFLLTFLLTPAAVCLGVWLGKRLARAMKIDASIFGGVLLIILAFLRL